MKNKLIYTSLIILCLSCGTQPSVEHFPDFVPSHTPYIAGLIEASYDTTHHYSEVVVGYFTDIYEDANKRYIPGLLYKYPGIYNPDLLNQLVETSILFGLSWQPETDAIVQVSGPLGTLKERTVTFKHEGKGIYGDNHYKLPLIPNERYKLTVILPDGRTYQSITHIPEATTIELPDSVTVTVDYIPFDDGTPKEEAIPGYPIPCEAPENSFIRVKQVNSNHDREILLLDPGEHFKYSNRSPYLRLGSYYAIVFSEAKDNYHNPWIQRLDKPRDEIWVSEHLWVRCSFFSKGIGGMFSPLNNWHATTKKFATQYLYPSAFAAVHHDTTFLFEASTIYKVGPNGKVLPKKKSDAIGFFAGYFSIYRQTTMYPIRTFDLDSVLATTGDE